MKGLRRWVKDDGEVVEMKGEATWEGAGEQMSRDPYFKAVKKGGGGADKRPCQHVG